MELRKDYVLDRWVIISEARASRPKELENIKQEKKAEVCYFCPGSEELTPKEIGRLKDGKGWKIRWFPNKFPAVTTQGDPAITKKGILTSAAAFGNHEVVVETPDHSKQLADLPTERFVELLKVYSDRIKELSKAKETKYVVVFKNSGPGAGTSLIHSHTQIASINLLPEEIANEIMATKKQKVCPYCKIIEQESKSPRLIAENKSCIAIAPYASRFHYESWIFPKRHRKSLTEFNDAEYRDCAELLRKVIVKLGSMQADYNFILHYAPKGSDLHFHIEVLPRMSTWAGFEYNTGIVINSVPPEKAAEFYRS